LGPSGTPNVFGWADASWDGIISAATTHLLGAYRLLERLEGMSSDGSERWTFFEVDDAIRCVSHALQALDSGPAVATLRQVDDE
jgi:hypothetical protein